MADIALLGAALYFAIESFRERESRAAKMGVGITLGAVLIGVLILWVPGFRIPMTVAVVLAVVFGLLLFMPGKADSRALEGAMGAMVDEPVRHDERDIPFARLRSVPPGSEPYRTYYAMHPELEEKDAKRREKGLLGEMGRIDKGYRPNVAMMEAAFDMPHFLGPFARNAPSEDAPPAEIPPERATEIVKNLALHNGADAVGICRVNPLWIYSHRGEIFYDRWQEWGKELDPEDFPPYAVVMLTEMDKEHVWGAPHTPTVAESATGYARGAYLGTMLARWFVHMGYRGIAENTRNYDLAMPPLAVDAGLGEIGRLGYLIAPRFGARVRVFATLTDMPLIADKPVSIGVDAFCKRCRKCAESCPSGSIPSGDKEVYNGALKWKLNADTCFDFWSKVGTDCSICMAVCPFSRPDTLLHRVIRWFVARSPLAQGAFPYVDNALYGKKWRPKRVPSWLDSPKGADAHKEVYGRNDSDSLG